MRVGGVAQKTLMLGLMFPSDITKTITTMGDSPTPPAKIEQTLNNLGRFGQ